VLSVISAALQTSVALLPTKHALQLGPRRPLPPAGTIGGNSVGPALGVGSELRSNRNGDDGYQLGFPCT